MGAGARPRLGSAELPRRVRSRRSRPGRGVAGLHVLCGSIRVDDAEYPEAAPAKLHRHPDGGADHSEVEVETEELKSRDPDQEAKAFQILAQIEVSEPWNHGEGRRQARTLPGSGDRCVVAA